MKKIIKSAIHKMGLLNIIEPVYFNMRSATLSVLSREFGSKWGNQGENPFPPAELIYDIIACRWKAVYHDSGKLLMDDMMSILKKNNINPQNFEKVLDFGCGCGRLIRHFPEFTNAKLFGTDYNPTLIKWCQDNLVYGEFGLNQLAPPLYYVDNQFDYLYARSIFTHLPEDLQLEWMVEFCRVMKPGGLIYLTMHGWPLSAGLTESEVDRMKNGELVVTYAKVAGENLCSTYCTTDFVEQNLLNGFKIIDFVEGRDQKHLRQDIYLLQKI